MLFLAMPQMIVGLVTANAQEFNHPICGGQGRDEEKEQNSWGR